MHVSLLPLIAVILVCRYDCCEGHNPTLLAADAFPMTPVLMDPAQLSPPRGAATGHRLVCF